jgi:3-hydroxyisobutyrate dehydrogenase
LFIYSFLFQGKKDIQVLEAPITGGVALLRQSKMTVLVGGDEHLFKECLPILQQTNKVVLHVGKVGTATIAKVISNMLAAVNNVTMGEALIFTAKI